MAHDRPTDGGVARPTDAAREQLQTGDTASPLSRAALDAYLDATEAALLRAAASHAAGAWLFLYGSLLWCPNIEYSSRRRAVLLGHARRFAQASPDHRGVPGAEGRVATLVPAASGALVHGDAVYLPPGSAHATLAGLARRERAGYTLARVRVLAERGGDGGGGEGGGAGSGGGAKGDSGGAAVDGDGGGADGGAGAQDDGGGGGGPSWLDACVYVAVSDSPFLVEGEGEDAIARVVGSAAGPSGTNISYFARVLHEMRARGVADGHLEAVAAALEPGALASALRAAAALDGASRSRVGDTPDAARATTAALEAAAAAVERGAGGGAADGAAASTAVSGRA